MSNFGTAVLVQLTSALRHMAAEERVYRLFLMSGCVDPWTKLVEMFPTSNELMFNLLRILSKLSAEQEICAALDGKKQFLRTLCSFFKVYRDSIHVVIRVAYIFA
jgi:hypothetical protein